MTVVRSRLSSYVVLVSSLLSMLYVIQSEKEYSYEKTAVQSPTSPQSSTTLSVSTSSTEGYLGVGNGIAPPTSEEDYDRWEKACADAGQSVPDQCLVASLSEILQSGGPSMAVASFKQSLEIPRVKVSCHTPSHRFGGLIYSAVKDIAKALEAVDGSCELGVIHGVFETWGETVSLDFVRQSIPSLCAEATSRDTTFPPRKCAHGAGHAVWPASRGDLKASLEVCDTLGDEFTVSECGGGVTMSMLMGVGTGKPVAQDSISDVAELCNSYSKNHKMSCITETGPMALRLARMDVAKAVVLCGELENLMASGKEYDVAYHCTSAVGYSAPQQAAGDPAKIVDLCAPASTEKLVGGCLYGAIKQMRLRDLPTLEKDLKDLCAVVPAFYSAECNKAATEKMDY